VGWWGWSGDVARGHGGGGHGAAPDDGPDEERPGEHADHRAELGPHQGPEAHRRARAGASGRGGELGTSWLVDPVRDLIVIVLTQRLSETVQVPQVHRDLQDAAYAALT